MGKKIQNLLFVLAFSLALAESIKWGPLQSTAVAGTAIIASYIDHVDKAVILATFAFAFLLRLLFLT